MKSSEPKWVNSIENKIELQLKQMRLYVLYLWCHTRFWRSILVSMIYNPNKPAIDFSTVSETTHLSL